MAGLGWQELVILLLLVMFWIAPVVLIWRVSQQERGRPALGWILLALVVGGFAWIVACIFLLERRRKS